MILLLLLLLKIYLITWFITNFEPFQDLITNYLSILQIKKIKKSIFWFLNLIYNIISCHKCLVLWTTLFITLNPFYAIGLSYIAYLLKK